MRNLLACFAAAALLVAANPSIAAITQITGTGTGGAIGGNSFSSTASLGITTTASIPAGSLVVVIAANCATGTVTSFSVSDTHSNTYAAPAAINQANGAGIQIFYSYTGTTINSGDTITVGLSGPTGCLTGQILAFAGAASSPYDVSAGGQAAGGTGTLSIGPTASLACPTGAAGCEVLVAGEVLHTARTTTNDANYTATTAFGAGQNWMIGFWIVGATTAQSYAPSISGGTSNWGGQLVAFKAASAAAGAMPCPVIGSGVTC